MPLLAMIGAIKVTIYYEANSQHHEPHVHVAYNEYKAVYNFRGKLVKGEMPNPQNKAASEWIAAHRGQLMDAWDKAMKNMAVNRIQQEGSATPCKQHSL